MTTKEVCRKMSLAKITNVGLTQTKPRSGFMTAASDFESGMHNSSSLAGQMFVCHVQGPKFAWSIHIGDVFRKIAC